MRRPYEGIFQTVLNERTAMPICFDTEIGGLLDDLLAVQDDLLRLLADKRQMLAAADVAGLASIGPVQQQLVNRLQECLRRREQLLALAGQQGMPAESIRALTEALPKPQRARIDKHLRLAEARQRLLRHQSLVNWVLVQRHLLYLSQLLEIIATGGRLKPTYEKDGTDSAHSGLVDSEA